MTYVTSKVITAIIVLIYLFYSLLMGAFGLLGLCDRVRLGAGLCVRLRVCVCVCLCVVVHLAAV